MSRLLKSLGAAFAFVTLVPTPAAALPKDCDVACSCAASCDKVCTLPGGRTVITCGIWELEGCADICFSQAPEARSAEEQDSRRAEPVCRKPQEAQG